MPLNLQFDPTFDNHSSVPVEVDSVQATELFSRTPDQAKRLMVWQGNRQIELGKAFHITGSGSDETVCWNGDLTRVHGIGAGHSHGLLIVNGDAGRHVADGMSGGTVRVNGDVGDFAATGMTGGALHICGNAGDRLGAHQNGERWGMNGGTILVTGDVGAGAGEAMRRGTIVVGGQAGKLTGWNMFAGTICVFGQLGAWPGAGMVRGTIIAVGQQKNLQLMPTFRHNGATVDSAWLGAFARWMRRLEVPQWEQLSTQPAACWHGDFLHGGRGEILVLGEA